MKLTILLTFLSSAMAFAVNTNFCPSRVMTMIQVERVFKTSIYSQTPGWKDAQNNLKNTDTIKVTYILKQKESGRCLYTDSKGQNKATLTTAKFWEPDEWKPNLITQFILNFKIKNSEYVSYVPVKSVAVNGLSLYQNPFKIKVKASLQADNSGAFQI